MGMDDVASKMKIIDFLIPVRYCLFMSEIGDPAYFSAQISQAKRFHLDLNPQRDSALTVVSGGLENCSPEYQVERSGFPFFGLEFVAQGRGEVKFGEDTVGIQAGSLFSYGPDTRHAIRNDPGDPMVKYFVDFTGLRAGDLLKTLGPAPGTVVQTSTPGEVLAVFEDLIRNGMEYTPFGGRIAIVMLELLLLRIAESSIPNESAGSPAFGTYRRCRQYIQEHWQELRSLGEVATACHVDPAYLCRLFKKFDRQSPYQMLLRLKVNHGAVMLQAGLSVARVSEELLFADPFHFSRTFKSLMGIAPSHFARLQDR